MKKPSGPLCLVWIDHVSVVMPLKKGTALFELLQHALHVRYGGKVDQYDIQPPLRVEMQVIQADQIRSRETVSMSTSDMPPLLAARR